MQSTFRIPCKYSEKEEYAHFFQEFGDIWESHVQAMLVLFHIFDQICHQNVTELFSPSRHTLMAMSNASQITEPFKTVPFRKRKSLRTQITRKSLTDCQIKMYICWNKALGEQRKNICAVVVLYHNKMGNKKQNECEHQPERRGEFIVLSI